MGLINKIVSKVTSKRLQQIDFYRKNPEEVQNNVLFDLINKAQNTEFGIEHNFSNIVKNKSLSDFRKNIPLSHYEDLQPYVDRIIKGERNLLWQGENKWFAVSSGTTSSKSKYIPISKDSLELCHFRGGRDIMAMYSAMFPETDVFKGRILAVGGSQQVNSFGSKQYYGDLSAVLLENMPLWLKFLRTPSHSTVLMSEWEEKIEKMAKETIKTRVTNISGVPSWTLVLLKRILEITGKNNLIDVWPNLELFVHGGVSFTPYRNEYKKIIQSSSMNYLEIYNASEGFFAIQDDLKDPGMLLTLDNGVFYEFIPPENILDENPKSYTVEDVEIGKNYAIVISTNAGLWRYVIGDTVKFTSKHPHKIVITGRIKHFINAFGEELIIDNAENALKIACDKTGATIKEYTAAPIFMKENSTGGHEWLIEFNQKPDNFENFCKILDDSLKAVNSDYEAKRHKNMALQTPVIHIAKDGVFYKWLAGRGKLGGQNKIPRLANNRDYIEPLLELNK